MIPFDNVWDLWKFGDEIPWWDDPMDYGTIDGNPVNSTDYHDEQDETMEIKDNMVIVTIALKINRKK